MVKKKMTFGEVLLFLQTIAPRMTEYMGEEWGEHVMELSAVIEDMMAEQDISRSDKF